MAQSDQTTAQTGTGPASGASAGYAAWLDERRAEGRRDADAEMRALIERMADIYEPVGSGVAAALDRMTVLRDDARELLARLDAA